MKEKIACFINSSHEKISDKLDVLKITLANCYLDKEKEHLLNKYREKCSVCQGQLDILEDIRNFINN